MLTLDTQSWSHLALIGGAVILQQIMGMIYYGPVMGNAWLKSRNMTAKDLEGCDLRKPMAISLITSGIFAEVLFFVVGASADLHAALTTVFWLWFGFNVTTVFNKGGWEDESFAHMAITCGWNLIQYVGIPKVSSGIHWFCVDSTLVYEPFIADFGPLHLGHVYRFCKLVQGKLDDPSLAGVKLVHYSSSNQHKRSNAVHLMGCFGVAALGWKAADAVAAFANVYPPLLPFRDASYGPSTYNLIHDEVWRGLYRGMQYGWFSLDSFDVESYDKYQRVEGGDMNWIVPNRFLAFSGPHAANTYDHGYRLLTPEDYIPYFKANGIDTIVRFNKAVYDKSRFESRGFKFVDLYYIDGGLPTDAIIDAFMAACEASPSAVAVHCKAGLGRTGSLLSLYMMKHYGLTASECLGWLRLCRPGSVIGPQQHYLHDMEALMHSEGADYRARHNIASAAAEAVADAKLETAPVFEEARAAAAAARSASSSSRSRSSRSSRSSSSSSRAAAAAPSTPPRAAHPDAMPDTRSPSGKILSPGVGYDTDHNTTYSVRDVGMGSPLTRIRDSPGASRRSSPSSPLRSSTVSSHARSSPSTSSTSSTTAAPFVYRTSRGKVYSNAPSSPLSPLSSPATSPLRTASITSPLRSTASSTRSSRSSREYMGSRSAYDYSSPRSSTSTSTTSPSILTGHVSRNEFDAATAFMSCAAAAEIEVDSQTQLELYALYKQVHVGDCHAPAPSMLSFTARAKWDAWNSLSGMSATNAMALYVAIVDKLAGTTWRELSADDIAAAGKAEAKSQAMGPRVSTMARDEDDDDAEDVKVSAIAAAARADHDDALAAPAGPSATAAAAGQGEPGKTGSMSAMRLLVAKAKEEGALNALDGTGIAPLHAACDMENLDLVSALIEAGADVNICDSDGSTPLHYAVVLDNVALAKLLLAAGAAASLAVADDDGLPADNVSSDEMAVALAAAAAE
ncbi:uncharacterized protein AMSG_12182 [Thecamonas trahens ATCC 50062]|uniref:protein-tyrosine-phosphatase n=1 Tax=Thecamonas trahens ATCC 50062 TaxID=461836 RepID=A0A0L0DKZ6_THETB|nr:hypothetical protein AMSG_12182 [Thecamonas trahens ATCC 50062]KNC52701.1 hypothetical protein AMSG_12182 [Thecamonas trahens ATCC 50062]|eukprot:XP_013755124.1 hypothetical protein AMSG_12182 [Thecamonas trahens ATCC 50062]